MVTVDFFEEACRQDLSTFDLMYMRVHIQMGIGLNVVGLWGGPGAGTESLFIAVVVL